MAKPTAYKCTWSVKTKWRMAQTLVIALNKLILKAHTGTVFGVV